MAQKQRNIPDNTAVRTALWRALHIEADSLPHVFEDDVGLRLVDPEIRPGVERAAAGAKTNGTPWLSFFTPTAMLTLAQEEGFKEVKHISAEALGERYFTDRSDGLRPPRNSEELLVAST